MTRDEIIAILKTVGVYPAAKLPTTWDGFVDVFSAFAENVADAEREACAKVCEEVGARIHGAGRDDSEAFDCADAIRARGEK